MVPGVVDLLSDQGFAAPPGEPAVNCCASETRGRVGSMRVLVAETLRDFGGGVSLRGFDLALPFCEPPDSPAFAAAFFEVSALALAGGMVI